MSDSPNFPSNSKQPRRKPEEPKQPTKNIKPVAAARPKKKSLGKQFSETFVGGDFKTTAHYVIFDVAIPGLKDMIADSTIQGVERLIFGQARTPRRGMPLGRPGPAPGRMRYDKQFDRGPATPGPLPQRTRPMTPQEVGDFQDILIETRAGAERVREGMYNVLSQYDEVSVADLYSLVEWPSVHTDNNYGWTDLRGSSISRDRHSGMYLLNLPDPKPFV